MRCVTPARRVWLLMAYPSRRSATTWVTAVHRPPAYTRRSTSHPFVKSVTSTWGVCDEADRRDRRLCVPAMVAGQALRIGAPLAEAVCPRDGRRSHARYPSAERGGVPAGCGSAQCDAGVQSQRVVRIVSV